MFKAAFKFILRGSLALAVSDSESGPEWHKSLQVPSHLLVLKEFGQWFNLFNLNLNGPGPGISPRHEQLLGTATGVTARRRAASSLPVAT